MKALLLPMLILAIAGCAQQRDARRLAACERNWRAVGYADGALGATEDRFAEHARACARAGGALTDADREAWREGWREGGTKAPDTLDLAAPPRENANRHPRDFLGIPREGELGALGLGYNFSGLRLDLGWGF